MIYIDLRITPRFELGSDHILDGGSGKAPSQNENFAVSSSPACGGFHSGRSWFLPDTVGFPSTVFKLS